VPSRGLGDDFAFADAESAAGDFAGDGFGEEASDFLGVVLGDVGGLGCGVSGLGVAGFGVAGFGVIGFGFGVAGGGVAGFGVAGLGVAGRGVFSGTTISLGTGSCTGGEGRGGGGGGGETSGCACSSSADAGSGSRCVSLVPITFASAECAGVSAADDACSGDPPPAPPSSQTI